MEELKAKGKLVGRSTHTPAGELAQVKVKWEHTHTHSLTHSDTLNAERNFNMNTVSLSLPPPPALQVIDMTGREQKVYYSYSQMTNKHSVPEEAPLSMSARDQKPSGFALPELEHNLQLLIDLTEQDILRVTF